MDSTRGMASKANRIHMEKKDRTVVLALDFPIFAGSVSPINIKLKILKSVPMINPFPMGFKPNRKKEIAAKIARLIASEQYFFWVCLICSILTVFVFEYFHNLTVDDDSSADNPKDYKNGCK